MFIKGRNLFMGYIGEPKATSDTLTEDGWLKSGDIGYINHVRERKEEEGREREGRTGVDLIFSFIFRKDFYTSLEELKVCIFILFFSSILSLPLSPPELLVLATGENIAPVPIESALKEQLPILSNAVIVGDQKSFISCLLTLKVMIEITHSLTLSLPLFLKVEFDEVSGFPTDRLNPTALAICQTCGSRSKTVRDILDEPSDHRVLKMIQNGIDRVNKGAVCKKHKVRERGFT